MVALLSSAGSWRPTKIRRVVRPLDTGTQAVEVFTDAGPAFAKFLGNKEGPHVLAAELIGTRLAAILGLQIFDYAVVDYDGVPEVVLESGAKAEPGPAWLTRCEEGISWSGGEEHLALLANPADVAGLIVLDTWTRNCDRHCPVRQPPRVNRNNVFFSREAAPEGRFRLVAMDHTHILSCGREFTHALMKIDIIKDETVYGLFPEFRAFVQPVDLRVVCGRLAQIDDSSIREVVESVPTAWQVDHPTRDALWKLLTARRDYVARDLPTRVFGQLELPNL